MKILLLVLLSLTIMGCEKNPYPEIGNFRDEDQGPQGPRREVPPSISADLPKKIELKEGSRTSVKFKIKVKAPAKPVVWIDDLPAGAVFDKDRLELSWIPGYFDGNDPKDPTIKTRSYYITVWYKNSEDPPSKIRKALMALEVTDVPQAFDIDADDNESVNEGSTLYYDFEVSNLDYPQGPFKVYTEGLPANTMVEQLTETKFRLVFKPDYQHVKINDNPNPCSSWNKDCLRYEGKITVTNPANHQTQKDVEIDVEDVRREVKLVTPDIVQQGLDISFSVSSVDPNGEVAPKITLDSARPDKGDFKTSLQRDEENNSSVLSVVWSDIPPLMNGKSHTFRFESCVLGSRNSYNECDRDTFTVKIVVKDRKPPYFERSDWAQGEIKYLNYNESDSFYVYVKDGDSHNYVDTVEIKPAHLQKYVSYSNNRIRVRFDKPGYHQFSLVATSDYNLSSAESFVVEVFEKTRSKTLYFTDSTRDDEVRFYRDTMGNVQMMNPVLQVLNDRNLSGRDTLILGTGILKDTNLKTDIERAMKMIDNVVIASPLIKNMPEKFLNELESEFRVSILGRYSDIRNAPKLEKMYFVARSEFQTPKEKIQLKLNSTDESYDPLIFSIGVDRENCQDVLDFTNKGSAQGNALFKIGVICDRPGRLGRFAILGTEFSDLKTSEQDKTIPARWLRTMLNTRLSQDEE